MHTVLHRKTQSVGLPRLMIRVLSDNHHLHLVERAEVEGIENQVPWWIACCLHIFLSDSSSQLLEVRLLKFALQLRFPRFLNLYLCHFFLILFAKL